MNKRRALLLCTLPPNTRTLGDAVILRRLPAEDAAR